MRVSRTARRWLVFVTAVALMVAAAAGTALGLSVGSTSSPSLPQLQPPSQLPSAPEVSVPTPSVPSAPSAPSAPSVPQVSTPHVSTPQVSTPSAPSVSAPRLPSGTSASGGGGSSAGGGGSGPSGGGSTGSSAAGGGSSSGRGSAAARRAAASPQQNRRMQLHRATRDRQLRTEVTRLRGCLGAVPGIGRRVLTLRAGLSGPAKSRAATASALGIPVSREARIERGALRTLQAAAAGGCGGGGITSTSGTATAGGRPAGVPALQPASFLVASTQPLLSPGTLGG